MIPTPRLCTRSILSPQGANASIPKTLLVTCLNTTLGHSSAAQPRTRAFHTTLPSHAKSFFPTANAPAIRTTKPAWHHPIYTEEQMKSIVVAHRETKNWSDWTALSMVRVLRWGMDLATGYKHDNKAAPGSTSNVQSMTEQKYIMRNIFLESVAGVPGMVGGMLRHLHSMRRMKRDNGWIETLLEESYNERMHLLTFLQMAEPGLFMRVMVLGAQGVFFNAFFLAYLISPRTCHRFVGYLEEEAVLTYTREIEDIDAGKLPLWSDPGFAAPPIAVGYWRMPEGKRTMRDLLLYIRADEAKHREVNHTLGNLEQKSDPNPFVSEYMDPSRPHPGKDIANMKATGWERADVIEGETVPSQGRASEQSAQGERECARLDSS